MSRRPLLAAAAAAVVLLAGLTAAAVLGPGGRPVPGAGRTAAPCGGVRVPVPGGAWPCTFDDEFSGSRLDAAHWEVLRTAEFGFTAGPECYLDDSRHVRVGGGVLTLTATRAGRCAVTGRPYASGAVASYGHFAQRYGRFAVRARLPDVPGVQPALWMYPAATAYGGWPRSGEIDIAELYGTGDGAVWPHLHYAGADGAQQHPGRACRVTDPGGRFHVYAVDWTPAGFRFSYDGATCFRLTAWTPAPPLVRPQPFDRPFFVLLELALGSGGGGAAPPSAATRLPVSMTVDWVRAWGTG